MSLVFLGGLSCGEADERMGDCESAPIAACQFSTLSLSVPSSVSVTAKTRSLIEWNVLSSMETTIAGVR